MKHIVDTHAMLWFLGDSARLGANADAVLQNPNSELVLPVTALAEACWIIERGRVPVSIADVLAALDSDPRIVVYPLERTIVEKTLTLTTIGEMHDRQIVATALILQEQGETVAILTKDANIIASGVVPVVW